MIYLPTDLELVEQLNDGKKKAFETIYDRYADSLYGYVYNRIKIKPVSEEIVQDIFLSLWSKHQTLEITTSLEAYLYGACKYKILTYVRSDLVRKRYAADFMVYVAGKHDNSVEEFMNLADIRTTIEKSIGDLPDKCQMAFRLSRMDHLPIPDIAEKMNISTRTVENYLSQALRHLRITLGEFMAIVVWMDLWRH